MSLDISQSCVILFDEIKMDMHNPKRPRKMIKCKCNCCEKCWIYEDSGVCLYGGPFSEYK